MTQWAMKISLLFSKLASGAGGVVAPSAPEKVSFWDRVGMFFASTWQNIKDWFINILYSLFYAIGKLILNIVDFLAIAVKELAGQNTVSDLANIKKATEVDMVFRFIFDSTVWNIFKAIVGLAIVLLIVFTIVAVLKNEYDAFLGGAEDNSKGQIVRRMLTSVFLILIVPFVAFAGVLLSNAVLTSVDNALGQRGQNSTIASEVFIASTYTSNKYRAYADAGSRIPITFDFESVEKNSLKLPEAGYSNEQMNSSMQAYLEKDAWNRGLVTWWQFYNKQFFGFEDIETAQVEAETGNVQWSDFFDKNLQINQVEYYVMADVVDFLVRTRESLYVVNAFDLAQQKGLNDGVSGSTSPFWGYDKNGAITTNFDAAEKLVFRVYYGKEAARELPGLENEGDRFFVDYVFDDSSDEADGAMFLLCTGSWQGEGDTKTFVYEPLLNNSKKSNSYSGKFWSDYLEPSQLVVARGMFDNNGYPTAIREAGGQIEFYRDNVEAPSLVDLLPQITYESEDGKVNIAGGFNKVFQTITGVDISELVPKVYFRNDAWNFFTKRTAAAVTLSSNELYLDYNFSNNIPLSAVENVSDINILVLLFGSILLLSVLGKAVFGLISRVFDLVLLFITYPIFAATMPIDDGKRFSSWTETFVGKVLGTYGIVIGLNLVFILLPVIAEFNAFFSLEFVTNNMRPTWFSATTMTSLMNFGVWLMFYLVAFTFIKTAGAFVSKTLGGHDAMDDGEAMFGDVKNIIEKTAEVVSGKVIVNAASKLAGDVKGFIPGSAAVARVFGKDAREKRKDKRELKAEIAARKKELKDADASKLAGRITKDEDKAKKAKKKEKEEKDKAAWKKTVTGDY